MPLANGEPVHVPAPSIPGGNQGTDELVVALGDQKGGRGVGDQALDVVQTVRRARVLASGLRPKPQDGPCILPSAAPYGEPLVDQAASMARPKLTIGSGDDAQARLDRDGDRNRGAGEDRADEIQEEWGEEGQDAARQSLWIDFGYLLAYGALLTLALAATRDLARARGWRRLATIGGVVGSFGALAAVFDALENACLLLTLDDAGSAFPVLATAFATCKFLLLGLAIAYLLVGQGMRLRGRDPAARTS